jgi:hypothetical protein
MATVNRGRRVGRSSGVGDRRYRRPDADGKSRSGVSQPNGATSGWLMNGLAISSHQSFIQDYRRGGRSITRVQSMSGALTCDDETTRWNRERKTRAQQEHKKFMRSFCAFCVRFVPLCSVPFPVRLSPKGTIPREQLWLRPRRVLKETQHVVGLFAWAQMCITYHWNDRVLRLV